MKRLLLALALLFATLIGNAAVDSGKSLVEVSEDYKTVTVTIMMIRDWRILIVKVLGETFHSMLHLVRGMKCT